MHVSFLLKGIQINLLSLYGQQHLDKNVGSLSNSVTVQLQFCVQWYQYRWTIYMNLGNDIAIWPLSFRACWNNYRTCVWRFLLAPGHGLLSNIGGGAGTAFTRVKSEGSGTKGQEGEMRVTEWWGMVKTLVGFGANLVRARGHGASTQTFLSGQRTSKTIQILSHLGRRSSNNWMLSIISMFTCARPHLYLPFSCVVSSPNHTPSFSGGILGTAARA